MANIKIARIDFRLIHGQVITKWIKYYPVDTIVIADDMLANDDFMLEIYKMAVPKGIKLKVTTIAKAAEILDSMDDKVFLLFKDIENCIKVIETGVKLNLLVVGGVPGGPGRVYISDGINLLPEEFTKLEAVNGKVDEIIFKGIPEEGGASMEKAKEKF